MKTRAEIIKESESLVRILDRVVCTGDVTRLIELMREFADRLEIFQKSL